MEYIIVPGQLLQDAVADAVGFAQEERSVFCDVEVASVGEGVEGVAVAVVIGHILEKPLTVDDIIFYFLVVGADVDICQPQTGEKTLIIRVQGLAGFFRLGIDPMGCVHRTGADGQHDTLVVLQQDIQTDLPEEGVLGGDMATGQDDEVAGGDQLGGAVGIDAVQDGVEAEREAGFGKGGEHIGAEPGGEVPAVRAGADEQAAGVLGEVGLQPVDQAVGGTEDGAVGAVHEGTAGKIQDHGGDFLILDFMLL